MTTQTVNKEDTIGAVTVTAAGHVEYAKTSKITDPETGDLIDQYSRPYSVPPGEALPPEIVGVLTARLAVTGEEPEDD
jgi:hypothetical protein